MYLLATKNTHAMKMPLFAILMALEVKFVQIQKSFMKKVWSIMKNLYTGSSTEVSSQIGRLNTSRKIMKENLFGRLLMDQNGMESVLPLL